MMSDFLGMKKPVVAMVHIGALPGTPLYDAKGGVPKLIDGVPADIERLQAGGVDAIMFGNENDRPYVFKAPPEGVAAMTAVIQARKPRCSVPFGVNYLWDPLASVAIGAATGARFVREIFTGLFASDMGLWQPDAAAAARLAAQSRPRRYEAAVQHQRGIRPSRSTSARSNCARRAPCSPRWPTRSWSPARSPDSPSISRDLRAVREAVSNVPVFANTGVNIDNVRDILALADGVVIGTHFKVDGDTWNPVDGERVKRFMDVVATLR